MEEVVQVKVSNGTGKRVQLPDDVGHDTETTKRVRKPTLARKHTLWQLYEDDTSHFSLGNYLRSFKGGEDVEEGEDQEKAQVSIYHLKSVMNFHCLRRFQAAKLGTLLGVYLPSIQNVLGIQMFLRLLWIVGMAGVVESFSMVAVCCLCVMAEINFMT